MKKYILKKATRETWEQMVPFLWRAFCALALFFVVGVVVAFIKSAAILHFDQAANDSFLILRTPLLTKIFVWLTLLGNREIAILFLLIGAALFWLWKKEKYILPFWLTVAGAQLSSSIGKNFFARTRPLRSAYEQDSFSLPSGHATVAVALYGFLLYLAWRQMKNRKQRLLLVVLLTFLMLIIGISRLYLGMHFPSDIVAGYFLGGAWLILGIGATEVFFSQQEEKKNCLGVKQVKFISLALVILAVAIFLIFGQWFFESTANISVLS